MMTPFLENGTSFGCRRGCYFLQTVRAFGLVMSAISRKRYELWVSPRMLFPANGMSFWSRHVRHFSETVRNHGSTWAAIFCKRFTAIRQRFSPFRRTVHNHRARGTTNVPQLMYPAAGRPGPHTSRTSLRRGGRNPGARGRGRQTLLWPITFCACRPLACPDRLSCANSAGT